MTVNTMPRRLTRLLQLASPGLPVGAFAYSQGLEYAVHAGWIHDEASAREWVYGVLQFGLGRLDLPVAWRLGLACGDESGNAGEWLRYWNAFLWASRESMQIQQQEQHMAWALGKLLREWCEGEPDLPGPPGWCYATVFMRAAVRLDVDPASALIAYAWAWLENASLAAVKLIPLGQTAGQRILFDSANLLEQTVSTAIEMPDTAIGCNLPGLAAACVLHETLYSRLFRS